MCGLFGFLHTSRSKKGGFALSSSKRRGEVYSLSVQERAVRPSYFGAAGVLVGRIAGSYVFAGPLVAVGGSRSQGRGRVVLWFVQDWKRPGKWIAMFRFRRCGFSRDLRLRLPVTFVWKIEQERAMRQKEKEKGAGTWLGRQVQGGEDGKSQGEAEKVMGGDIGRKEPASQPARQAQN